MTTIFEGAPKFDGIRGDKAKVTTIDGRVLIRCIDTMAEEAVTIAMTPDQARKLAAWIVVAANDAETDQLTPIRALPPHSARVSRGRSSSPPPAPIPRACSLRPRTATGGGHRVAASFGKDEMMMIDLEPGDTCPEPGCGGVMDIAPALNCSCHISPPCSSCENAGARCDKCGYDTTTQSDYEDLAEYEQRLWRAKAGACAHEVTWTHTANPFNSTPFTRCCGIAAIDKDRCPHCYAKILLHDDGLSARRAEVGPGNCLMCGKPRGDWSIIGNCNC